jgi:hypothetical protein
MKKYCEKLIGLKPFAIMLILNIWFVVHSISAFAAVETEPNDKLGLANSITAGESLTGTFTPARDYDWYSITVTNPGRLVLSVTSPPSNIRAYITLYNQHADYISVYSYAVNDGDNVHLTHDVTDPGTYYIRLHDRDNDTSTDTYTFTASFTDVIDNNEPNNELGNAALINGSSLSGTIFDRHDHDWFKIWAQSGNTMQFKVDPPSEMRPSVSVYGPDMAYKTYANSVNAGDPITLEYSIVETGFHYFRMRDAMGRSHLETYDVTVTGGDPGYVPSPAAVTSEAEDNGNIGKANHINLGATVTGAISEAGDRDWFRFHVASPGELTISMDSVPSDLHPRFRLYNSSGNHVMTAQATVIGDTFSLTYEAAAPGLFFLMVDDIDSSRFSSGNYAFTPSLVEVNDPFEPNDNYGDAKKITEINRVSPFIFPRGDHDWFRVTVTDSETLRVIISDLPENIGPEISVYNTSKESLTSRSGAAGMDMEVVYTVPGPGDYLIRMRATGSNNSATSPYTMTIHGAEFDTYAPTARIDQIDPGAIVACDSISFTGSGIDSDGTIAGYSWRSSIDGVLSEDASFSTDTLSTGTHTVYFKVRDNDGIWSTEVPEVVYVGSSVSEEVEPNNLIGHANETAFGRPVPAKIDPAGDYDFFKVYVSRPGRLTWNVTNVPDNLRLYLTCYGRHMDYLSIYNYSNQDGDPVSLSMNITEPGFYFLRVHDRDSEYNTEFTYTLTASFTDVIDPQEPNNSLLDSFTMTQNSAQGYLFPANDHDWYRVWVDAGQTLQVSVTDAPSNLRPYITVYGMNREYLSLYSYAENKGDNPPALSRQFDTSGYVYIRVRDRDGNFNTTEMYTLTVSGANPGYVPEETPVTAETESNDVISDATLIVPETAVQGVMDTAADIDWFKFRMPAPGIIHTKIDPVPDSMRGRVRIYRDDASYVGGRDATNPGDALALDTRVTQPGLYYIQLDDLNRSNPDDPYRLMVAVTPVEDVHEPNNAIGDATILEDRNRTRAMIFDRGDEDWYRVTGTAGKTLAVTIADVPDEIQPVIDIFNSSKSRITGRTATNEGQDITVSCEMPEDGYYYIQIRHAGNNSFSDMPYTLIVNGARFNSYTPVAVIDSISPNPAEMEETVTLEGSGTDNDGEIVGYSWRSSIDGEFSVSRVASMADLSQGVHTISFMVMDNDYNWSPETTALLYYGVSAPAEKEPNDVIGQSTPMSKDTIYSGKMDKVRDYDYFRVTVEQPGRLTVDAVNPTGSSPMRLYLTGYSLDADYVSKYSYANVDGDPVTLVWDIAEPGDYFIRVHDNGGRTDGQYTIIATLQAALDPYEPNGDAAGATSLDIGSVIQAGILPAGDEDWFKVDIHSRGRLSISMTDMPSNLRGYITLYDSNNEYMSVYTYANNEGDDVTLDYNVANPGIYYIKIHDRDRDTSLTPYTLSTTFTPVIDSNENNNEFKMATDVLGSPVEGYIFPSGDEDWYRIRAQGETTLEMTVEPPADLKPYLRLYGANNNYIGYTTTDTKGDAVTYTVENPGTEDYYLQVTDRDSDWSAGPYRLSVTGANLSPIPADSPVTTASGSNTAFKSADLIGTEGVSGTLATKDVRHWYRFEVAEASMLTLSLTVPEDLRPVLALYNANNGNVITRTAQNTGDFSWIQYAVDSPGVWYVLVYGADSGSESPYQLDVAMAPAVDEYEPNNEFAAARPLIFGEPVAAAIFPAKDQDWFSMEVDVPGIVKFTLADIPDNIEICLDVYDRNNSRLQSRESLNPGTPLEMAFYAPEADTYFVKIYDRGNNGEAVDRYTLTAFLTPFEDLHEPNDRYSEAAALSEQNQVSALVYPAGDLDWYSFTVSSPGTLRIQVTDTDGIQPHIQLYSSSKTSLAAKAAKNHGDDLLLTYTVTDPDRYFLVIRDDGNNDYSQRPYVLTIMGADFDVNYPIASIDSMLPNPSTAGEPVTLTGTGFLNEDEASGYEWVSDLEGHLGDSASLTSSNLSMGTHVIGFRIRDIDGNWSAWVRKRLHVTDEIVSEQEYNDSLDAAYPVPLSTWITGRIFPKRDEDFYKIYVDRRGYLSVLMDGVPPAMRGYATFYDGNQTYLSRYDYATNDGDWFKYGFYADPGWYYVRIHDRDSDGHEGTYGVYFDLTDTFDLNEPNDSKGSATPIETGVDITDVFISPANDEDWYRVEIPAQGRLSMSITGAPSTMRGYITLYGSDMDYLSVYNYAYNDGEDVFLHYDVLTAGTYFIKVHDRDGQAHTDPYTFKAEFTEVTDSNEPNDRLIDATLMTESSATGYIFPRNDEDWYRIYANEGETLHISVTDVPEKMRAQVNIYGINLNYLTYSRANNSGDRLYFDYTVPATGFYYIQVRDNNGISHTGSYRLAVQGGSPDYEPDFDPVTSEVEPNNGIGEATDIPLFVPPDDPLDDNTSITGKIDPYNDNDWFRFYVNSPGIVTVSHTEIPAEITSYLKVYDGGGNSIGHREATNKAEDNILVLTVDQGGYYYVQLWDKDNIGSDSNYTLRVTHQAVVDTNEPNNGYGTATPLGQDSVQGYLFPSGDQDWYRIFVRTPGSLSLSLDTVPDDLRPRIYLYDANKSQKGTWVGTNYGEEGNDLITWDVPESDFYYVMVKNEVKSEDKGTVNDYSPGPYELRITGADFTMAPVLDPIGDRTIDETISYTFTVNAFDPDNPMDLVFSASNLPSGASFDPGTRTFTWTPARGQSGVYSGINFKVSDGTYTDSEDITITVAGLNRAPVLAPIGNKSVPVGETLTFTLSATDPDGDTLTYSVALPYGTSGAELDGNTFNWTPADNQVKTHTDILFRVTDGTWTDFEYIDIEVTTTVPYVSTGDISDITETGVKVDGEVTMSGGAAVTERGVVYATHDSPTVDDSSVSHSYAGTGTYYVNLTGLEKGTQYYVRAYAVNSEGTAYGEAKSFSTKSVPTPLIHVTPESADFGEVRKESDSAPKRFTIINDGNAELAISAISITGDNSDEFLIQKDLCSNKTLAPSETGTLEIVFSPSAVGKRTAILAIPSNDPGTDVLTVEIVGHGLPIKGDINNDGHVDMQDAILAFKIVNGVALLPDDAVYPAADVNGDNVIGVHEIIYILNYLSETSE